MAEPNRIRKVVVLGRDESLWLAVNVLWRSFHKAGLDITAVELPSRLRPADVIPTLRSQEAFHNLLGLNEAALMQASKATFSLGQRFSNWAKSRPPFFHVYCTYGATIERVRFHHFWIKARAAGLKAEYEDFSMSVAAARQGRFFIPNEETDGLAAADYAYNLGAAGYCKTLQQVALQRGVRHVAANFAEARRDSQSGHITSLLLTNGQQVDGDFFIDATGSESLLLGQTLGVKFDSWRDWFPCDRILTAYAPVMSPLPPFNQISASRSGWLGLYPLRDRTALQQVYPSVDMTDQQAFETAAMVSSLRLNADPVVTSYTAGIRQNRWEKNCVAIGEAGVVMDPMDNARMQANLVSLSHLMPLFPVSSDMDAERQEYNRNSASALENLRDFQICRYKLNQRFDQVLWDHCRNMVLPDALQYKLDLFSARGNLVVYDNETFHDDEWIAMMIGHGLIPKAYDPLADQVSEGDVIRRFQQVLTFIRVTIEKMGPMEAHMGLVPARP